MKQDDEACYTSDQKWFDVFFELILNIMKTKEKVLKENSNYKNLINAVISQLGGMDSIEDINRHGIDGGYPGFTYYSDTHAFAIKHRIIIAKMLEDMADQLGEDVISMVGNFGVFRKGSPMDSQDKKDLYKFLSGGKPDQGAITNVMAWFAAEEVCRMFDN